ncbi:hypothetical protein COO60DRAFT_1564466 [Scenedesmus sp. NREL 46B-D3]|nr:hypothetical protein COO60DRAFT_1564466 [Scenedesmus sp. NREL 46B-D3]
MMGMMPLLAADACCLALQCSVCSATGGQVTDTPSVLQSSDDADVDTVTNLAAIQQQQDAARRVPWQGVLQVNVLMQQNPEMVGTA